MNTSLSAFAPENLDRGVKKVGLLAVLGIRAGGVSFGLENCFVRLRGRPVTMTILLGLWHEEEGGEKDNNMSCISGLTHRGPARVFLPTCFTSPW